MERILENAFARLKHYQAVAFRVRQAEAKLREHGSHGLRVPVATHVKRQQTLGAIQPSASTPSTAMLAIAIVFGCGFA